MFCTYSSFCASCSSPFYGYTLKCLIVCQKQLLSIVTGFWILCHESPHYKESPHLWLCVLWPLYWAQRSLRRCHWWVSQGVMQYEIHAAIMMTGNSSIVNLLLAFQQPKLGLTRATDSGWKLVQSGRAKTPTTLLYITHLPKLFKILIASTIWSHLDCCVVNGMHFCPPCQMPWLSSRAGHGYRVSNSACQMNT